MNRIAALLVLSVVLLISAFDGSRPDQEVGVLFGRVMDTSSGGSIAGANVVLEGTSLGAATRADGTYRLENVPAGTYTMVVSSVGFERERIEDVRVEAGAERRLDVRLKPSKVRLEEVVVQADAMSQAMHRAAVSVPAAGLPPNFNTEDYAHIQENEWQSAAAHPLSTFAVDVDGASYSNVRRFITGGDRPPIDAVRVEEMVNYFDYDYAEPEGDHPFSVVTEIAPAPWRPEHRLVHIGLQGRRMADDERPASNLVFLIDVSGSMASPVKLPLVKQAFNMLVDQLRPEDRVAIVVYAGASGLVLPSTPGNDRDRIRSAINDLQPGGYTAGAAGIQLAYETAQEYFIEGGNNRVILATDGDFNVGVSSNAELVRLIEEKREEGTFLTVLGFGMGNLKDDKMEALANHGNGSYYYIDSRLEAEKVLVRELGGTLYTIAKDVKVQVEFNPARVKGYRLIGYENRMLAAEDFADDRKDAGELGEGHTVTALYEVIPVGAETDVDVREPDELRYRKPTETQTAAGSNELMFVKLRYKAPDGDESMLIERPLVDGKRDAVSPDFQHAAAVAAFAMILRDSEHRGSATLDQVLALASDGLAYDPHGDRAGFVQLVHQYGRLTVEAEEAQASRE